MTRAATRDGEYALSALELDAACAELDIAPLPYPVAMAAAGSTVTERTELLGTARESLRTKGLYGRDGVTAGLASLLATVAGADATVDVLGFDRAPVRALAAQRGRSRALAVAGDDGIVLRSVGDTPMATALLRLFPDSPAGPGQSVAVPWQAFAELGGQAESHDDEFDPLFDPTGADTEVLRRHGVSAMDAIRICAIAEERLRGGQLGVATRARRGAGLRRSGTVLSFYDTQSGRYLMVNDGTWVSITPADARRIAQRVEQELETG